MTSPAILNMLQNYQPQGEANAMPTSPSGNMSQSNPYDSGIQSAIASARQSLGMTRDQEGVAMRQAMAAYGNQLGQMPRQTGFMNNLISGTAALMPAVTAHDQAENAAITQNQGMADKILRYRQQEEEKRALAEYRNAQLMEQKRNHDLMNSYRAQMMGQKASQNGGSTIEFEGRPFRRLDKIEQRHANSLKADLGNSVHELKNANKGLEELEKLTKNNKFSPIGGWSKVANPVKDFWGRFAGDEDLQKETAQRKLFASQLNPLVVSLERARKGGGVLGQGMYERLKPSFPDPENDDYETLMAKMKDLNNNLNLLHKAAKFSADQGIQVDVNDLDELFPENDQSVEQDASVEMQGTPSGGEELNTSPNLFSGFQQLSPEGAQELVLIQNPDTGEQVQVSAEDVPAAIQKHGWQIVE